MAIGDVFLKIDGARQGPIKGESIDTAHQGEIDVLSWSWGLKGNVNAFGEIVGRSTLNQMRVSKRVDAATTALMGALRTNEDIKKAVLTVRKAGGTKAIEFFKIVMEKGRITLVELKGGDDSGESTGLIEEINISFQKVSVEYQGQAAQGGSKGTTTFEAEVLPD